MTGLAPQASGRLAPAAAGVAAGLLAVAAALAAGPIFQTNDDVAIAMVGSGFGLAAAPDAHLIFAHAGYGLLLNVLTPLFGASTHGVLTYVALATGIAVCVATIASRTGDGVVRAALTACVVGAAFAPPLLTPQFTMTSGALAAASLCLVVAAVEDRALTAARLAAVLALGAASVLVRPIVLPAALAALGPWLLAKLASRDTRRAACVGAVASLAVFAALAALDWAAYAVSAPWSAALRYNALRGLFIDFGRVPWGDAKAFADVGWSINDYRMFATWFSRHPAFDEPVLRTLAGDISAKGALIPWANLAAWAREAVGDPHLLTLAAVAAACLAFGRGSRASVALLALGGLLSLAAAAATGRAPQFRFAFAMGMVVALPALVLSAPVLSRTAAAVLVAAGLAQAALAVVENREAVARCDAYRGTIAALAPKIDGPLVVWGDTLRWEWLAPPVGAPNALLRRPIVPIGGFLRTPVAQVTLDSLAIPDLAAALCGDARLRLISNEGLVGYLNTFCQERYAKTPGWRAVAPLGPDAALFAPKS